MPEHETVQEPVHDTHVDAPPAHSTSPESEAKQIEHEIDIVTQGFHWLNEAASQALDELKTDMQEADESPMIAELAKVALELALGSGAAAVGEFIAAKLVGEHAEVAKEALKALFEEGISKGAVYGTNQLLAGGGSTLSPDAFIGAQKEAVRNSYVESQKDWIRTASGTITSLKVAREHSDACSESNLSTAARNHYRTTRDAWLSYLARSKAGSVDVDGQTVTSMTDQKHRNWAEHPSTAPTPQAVCNDDIRGVLAVQAALPSIFRSAWSGKPAVTAAALMGVNQKIRSQFEGKPLSEAAIPRVIEAHVDNGDTFELRLDETGRLHGHVPGEAGDWLYARSLVGHREDRNLDKNAQAEKGLELLLNDLVPTNVLDVCQGKPLQELHSSQE